MNLAKMQHSRSDNTQLAYVEVHPPVPFEPRR
jgi:hypothetical protein